MDSGSHSGRGFIDSDPLEGKIAYVLLNLRIEIIFLQIENQFVLKFSLGRC